MRECSASLEVCESACNDIVESVKREIARLRVDKIRKPCAVTMTMQTAVLANEFARPTRDAKAFAID